MKKILSIFAVVSLLAVLVLPAVSLALTNPTDEIIPDKCVLKNNVGITMCPAAGQLCGEEECSNAGAQWGMCCMMDTVYTVSNWVFYLAILLSTIMIVFGGFTYITSSGDPTKSAKGKSIITYALIGLAVALLAKVLPSVMKFFLGV